MIEFINLFPALATLGLHFSHQDKSQFPYMYLTLRMPELQKLELFDIEFAATDPPCFLTSPKQTLKVISLERINHNSESGIIIGDGVFEEFIISGRKKKKKL